MLTLLPLQTTALDHDAARREGWGVFDRSRDSDGKSQLHLQRIRSLKDGTPPFATDRDAWEHVVTHARAGSALHRAALASVDDIERMLIEAACGAW